MPSDDLCDRDLADVATLIRTREVTVAEVTDAVLARIERLNPTLNCFITVLREEARAQAAALDLELQEDNWRGALHGIPVSIKDNFETRGVTTTGGSPTLKGWVPSRDADVITALKAAGAILVGKTNLQQFAYGAAHEAFGEVQNPHKLGHTCGGSSSGSAAATAAGLGFASVGTDTGGSVRIPAAFCGVVGLKPTYGLVSRVGALPVSDSLDHVGPITRSVRDCALMLAAITGGWADMRHPFVCDLEQGASGLRIGVVRDQARALIDPGVSAVFEKACRDLEAQGAVLQPIDLPDLAQAQFIMWLVSGVDAAERHRAQLRVGPGEFNPVMRARLETAQLIPATDYVHAQRVRERFRLDVQQVCSGLDALVLPTVGVGAYKIGTARLVVEGHEEDVPNIGSRLTALFNLTGNPAIAMPCGFTEGGLPVSLQIVGSPWCEAMLLRVARAYEMSQDSRRVPAEAAALAASTVARSDSGSNESTDQIGTR